MIYTEANRKRDMAYGGMSCVLEAISREWLYILPSHIQAMVKCSLKMHEEAKAETERQREPEEVKHG